MQFHLQKQLSCAVRVFICTRTWPWFHFLFSNKFSICLGELNHWGFLSVYAGIQVVPRSRFDLEKLIFLVLFVSKLFGLTKSIINCWVFKIDWTFYFGIVKVWFVLFRAVCCWTWWNPTGISWKEIPSRILVLTCMKICAITACTCIKRLLCIIQACFASRMDHCILFIVACCWVLMRNALFVVITLFKIKESYLSSKLFVITW